MVAALVIVPLVVLAAYGLSLRVRQYGWTPERITAAACVVVAACYAIGYAVVTLLSRGSLRGLEAVNVTTAFVIIGVLLALFSPVADQIRISVNDQVSRLEAGRLPSNQFDFGFLRFKAGRYGLAALNQSKVYNRMGRTLLRSRRRPPRRWRCNAPFPEGHRRRCRPKSVRPTSR